MCTLMLKGAFGVFRNAIQYKVNFTIMDLYGTRFSCLMWIFNFIGWQVGVGSVVEVIQTLF